MFEKISLNEYLWKQKILISIDACDQYENYDWLHIMQFFLLLSIIKIKVVIIKSVDNISMANDNFYNTDIEATQSHIYLKLLMCCKDEDGHQRQFHLISFHVVLAWSES